MSSRSEAEGRIRSSRARSLRELPIRVRCSRYLVSSVQTPRRRVLISRVDSREPPTDATAKAPSCSIRQTRGIMKSIVHKLTEVQPLGSYGCQISTPVLYITYKLAKTPTEVGFFSGSRKRSGFHSSLSGPQICGKLSGRRESFIHYETIGAHRLYTSM